jgi:hypothetical protein
MKAPVVAETWFHSPRQSEATAMALWMKQRDRVLFLATRVCACSEKLRSFKQALSEDILNEFRLIVCLHPARRNAYLSIVHSLKAAI